ncbi:MAG: hypothetical protein ACRC75_07825, partial [Olsenella sp.]
MSTVDFTNRLSLREAAELIAAIGTTNTILLKGEKGIGKSSIMKMLPEYLGPEYEYAYFDMGNKSEGDTAIPFPDRERKVMEFFINTALKLHTGKPVVIMLDGLPCHMEPDRSPPTTICPMLSPYEVGMMR